MALPHTVHVRPHNQITIPRAAVRSAGIQAGDVLEISIEGKQILLRPVRNPRPELSTDDWARLERQVRREVKAGNYQDYTTGAEARRHLRRLRS